MVRATVRVGCGAGYAGDRFDSAVRLADSGQLDYLILECLAERTMGLAQLERRNDASAGYGSSLQRRMNDLLPFIANDGPRRLRLVTNLGAANPLGAVEQTLRVAERLGIRGLRIAGVEGDDVLDRLDGLERTVVETGSPLADVLSDVEWAHAYVGAEAILPALRQDCDIVLTGRAADPSLFLAPMIHELGWGLNDWALLGRGTAAAHLLECGASVTGGYYAEPGHKDVPDILNIGMPIAEVSHDGTAVITKTPRSGGIVSIGTCREQMLYEIHDPSAYLTPDVTADFSSIHLEQVGPDQVRVREANGHARPDELKVILGMPEGFIGEGEMSYAGPCALERAELGADIVRDRLRIVHGVGAKDVRVEVIGYDAMLGPVARQHRGSNPTDVRLRVAAKVDSQDRARMVGHEVEALTVNGPAGGGGKRSSVRPLVAVRSTTIPRSRVTTTIMTERS